MIIFGSAIFGAAFGALRAKTLKGNRLDMVQYAAGFGIAFAILGLFVTIILVRMG